MDDADLFLQVDTNSVEELLPEQGRPPLIRSERKLPAPRSAWLLLSDDASYPSRVGIDRGDFHWTGAAHMEAGDTVFFYFVAPRKAIHLVGTAFDRPYWDHDAAIVSSRDVERHKWIVPCGGVVEIEPISYRTLCDVFGETMNMRGKSARYIDREHANKLLRLVRVVYSPAEWCTRLVLRPVEGRTGKPNPRTATLDDLRSINWESCDCERNIEEYFVEPMLQLMKLDSGGFTVRPQYPIGRKAVDYAVCCNDRPVAVIEVKIRTHLNRNRDWDHCKDLKQARGYATRLDVPFVIMDCEEVFCFNKDDTHPRLQFQRRQLTTQAVASVRNHILQATS